MSQPLSEVIAGILAYKGAEVEKMGDDSLEILCPPEVSTLLNIPEYGRLSFSYAASSDDLIYASYDSEFFRVISNLFVNQGKFAVAHFEPYVPNVDKLSKVINEKVHFGNATFRLNRIDTSRISYLLVIFKYTALSDEKQEGIFPLLINELNLSTSPLEYDRSEMIERLKESDEGKKEDQRWIKVFHAAYTSANRRIEDRMKDFIKSLERRLNRDIKRVYEYYETLKTETRAAIERKSTSSEKGDGIDKLRNKLEIIDSEQRWKVQDLVAKYTMSIKIEPLAAIRIATQTPVFWINIKRRLSSRQFPVTYNPVFKQFDPMPCEACFNPHGSYYICDDKLHILCGNCMRDCHSCGKEYCRACYSDKCPRCKKGDLS